VVALSTPFFYGPSSPFSSRALAVVAHVQGVTAHTAKKARPDIDSDGADAVRVWRRPGRV